MERNAMTEQEIIIRISDLTKCYGEKEAVSHLNLDIYKGEVFGLLGPNGAGKTTTTLMLTGLTEPTSGCAYIAGKDCVRETMEIKKTVGYLPDNVGFYNDLTGRENLQFTAALNGIPKKKAEETIDRLLLRTGLSEAGEQKVGTYSRGMRQRLGIADVLIKDPQVIIMDEPTLGIDPEGMRELLKLIRELAKQDGRTILISSHQLYQVQQICDRVGMFVSGSLLACGTIEELAKALSKDTNCLIELTLEPVKRPEREDAEVRRQETEEAPKALKAPVITDEQFAALLKNTEEVLSLGREGSRFVVSAETDIADKLLSAALSAGRSVRTLRHLSNDLEEIYRRYFEKAEHEHDEHGNQKNKRFISRNR